MKKYKWIFLIIAGGIFLVTVLKSKGCGEIKQEDFIKDFHQQNVEIISDLSKVSYLSLAFATLFIIFIAYAIL